MKILIANRAEIAVRIIRTAREMQIKTVAVFSEADRGALHVRMADEAYLIGPAPTSESYLNADALIAAAKRSGADAIHPGYGFLSENPAFARRAQEEGFIFIGPSAAAMEQMGSKTGAKRIARALGLPLVPGTDFPVSDFEQARLMALEIGFPVLIKASAGGGGKGMRIVYAADKLEEQLAVAISEARSAFGDGSVFLEKYVNSPRHIEIQILADQHGSVVHLFERECSIQRRHQKLVEEAPSSILGAGLREKMGQAAISLAAACKYTGAGTVEFILDDKLNFYFLEMNTRLQVEHPVTEFITGLDLVKEQIRIARGEKLGFRQEDLQIRGHAIELRVCAEDPDNDFLPDTGILTTYRLPSGPGVRVDNGIEEGMEVPIYYDPLLAKLIVFGSSREEAIERMKRAIGEYQVSGIKTTLDFGAFVMNHDAFRSGKFDTHFISRYFNPMQANGTGEEASLVALLGAKIFIEQTNSLVPKYDFTGNSNWKRNRKS